MEALAAFDAFLPCFTKVRDNKRVWTDGDREKEKVVEKVGEEKVCVCVCVVRQMGNCESAQ
jgi:hypothetical protein